MPQLRWRVGAAASAGIRLVGVRLRRPHKHLMASALSHAIVGLTIGTAFRGEVKPARFWILAAACAVVPDVDAVGFAAGIPYDSLLGHRGLTHSLAFAVGLSVLVTGLAFRKGAGGLSRVTLLFCFFLVTASHGLLDAMTDGGLGVAFFAPFETHRYFLPFRPIAVSPIGIGSFFGPRGVEILWSELRWVGLPTVLFVGCVALRRRMRHSSKPAPYPHEHGTTTGGTAILHTDRTDRGIGPHSNPRPEQPFPPGDDRAGRADPSRDDFEPDLERT